MDVIVYSERLLKFTIYHNPDQKPFKGWSLYSLSHLQEAWGVALDGDISLSLPT